MVKTVNIRNLCAMLVTFLLALVPSVEASTWGSWKNPSINVDIFLVTVLAISVTLFALYYRIRDRRNKSHWLVKAFTAFCIFAFILSLVSLIAILVAGNPDQQTFAVTDTDVAGNTTNASITKIGVDGIYENEHIFVLIPVPFPDYEEALIIYLERGDVNGNGTATFEVYALDSNGDIKATKTKIVSLKDYEDNVIKIGGFEKMYPEYVINMTYNGSSDLDKVSISRTLNQVVWTSDYAM